jgi:hypothetical protein
METSSVHLYEEHVHMASTTAANTLLPFTPQQ